MHVPEQDTQVSTVKIYSESKNRKSVSENTSPVPRSNIGDVMSRMGDNAPGDNTLEKYVNVIA